MLALRGLRAPVAPPRDPGPPLVGDCAAPGLTARPLLLPPAAALDAPPLAAAPAPPTRLTGAGRGAGEARAEVGVPRPPVGAPAGDTVPLLPPPPPPPPAPPPPLPTVVPLASTPGGSGVSPRPSAFSCSSRSTFCSCLVAGTYAPATFTSLNTMDAATSAFTNRPFTRMRRSARFLRQLYRIFLAHTRRPRFAMYRSTMYCRSTGM